MTTLAVIIAAFLGSAVGAFAAVAFIRANPAEAEEFVQQVKETVNPRSHGKAHYVEAPTQDEWEKMNGKPDFAKGLDLAPPAREE